MTDEVSSIDKVRVGYNSKSIYITFVNILGNKYCPHPLEEFQTI